MFLPALARRNAADHRGSISDRLLSVECSFPAGEALHQDPRVLVDQNAHAATPWDASRTTFSAASRISLATVKFNPESRRILRPCSTLVPSMRTTMGLLTESSRAAFTTPAASVSQRRIPPNMLINTACTAGSDSRMRKALRI